MVVWIGMCRSRWSSCRLGLYVSIHMAIMSFGSACVDPYCVCVCVCVLIWCDSCRFKWNDCRLDRYVSIHVVSMSFGSTCVEPNRNHDHLNVVKKMLKMDWVDLSKKVISFNTSFEKNCNGFWQVIFSDFWVAVWDGVLCVHFLCLVRQVSSEANYVWFGATGVDPDKFRVYWIDMCRTKWSMMIWSDMCRSRWSLKV